MQELLTRRGRGETVTVPLCRPIAEGPSLAVTLTDSGTSQGLLMSEITLHGHVGGGYVNTGCLKNMLEMRVLECDWRNVRASILKRHVSHVGRSLQQDSESGTLLGGGTESAPPP